MSKADENLLRLLQKRRDDFTIRHLAITSHLVDFASNDYLGFARSDELRDLVDKEYAALKGKNEGATGSRLITGNSAFYEQLEARIAAYHGAEAGLIYNSGYDANLGLYSALSQPNDVILYDELVHASIHDGIKMARGISASFKHNDVANLEELLKGIRQNPSPHPLPQGERESSSMGHGNPDSYRDVEPSGAGQHAPFDKLRVTQHVGDSIHPSPGWRGAGGEVSAPGEIYIATESLFSMDGDLSPLTEMIALCKKYNANLIVDEAHATGFFGKKGEGRIAELGLQNDCFARVHTFGKALGCHGAIVLGSSVLREFLINFSRSFVFTTALPLHNLVWIKCAYDLLPEQKEKTAAIQVLKKVLEENLKPIGDVRLQTGPGPIQAVIIPGNERARRVAALLEEGGIYAKAILYPTVPRGAERIRICLHNFNTPAEVINLSDIINKAIL